MNELNALRQKAAEDRRVAEKTVVSASAPAPMKQDMAATAVVSLNQLKELRSQSSQPPSSPAEWYVLISGQQTGPMNIEAVKGRLDSGDVDSRTFVWKNGMADWKRLADVAPLRELVDVPAQGFGESTRMIDSKTLRDAVEKSRAAPESMFAEHTTAMPADELARAVASMGSELNQQTATISQTELQAQLERTRAEATNVGRTPFDKTGPAMDARAPSQTRPSQSARSPDEFETGEVNTLAADPAVAQGSGGSPDAFSDAAFASGSDAEDHPFDQGMAKAKTQVRPLGAVAAATHLIGEPTGEGLSRDDGNDRGAGSSLTFDDDPFGSLDEPFGAPSGQEEVGDLSDHFSHEEVKPPSNEVPSDSMNHDAPPGEQTRVFMATAGIFKRRRRNQIAAILGGSFAALLATVISLDFMGIYSIPGLGLAYDLTGIADPNKDRAIQRTLAKLDSAADDAERAVLKQKLLGLQKGGEESTGSKRRGAKRSKGSKTVTEGIIDNSDLSKDEKKLAESLFEDDRKSGSAPKLKPPDRIATADLPEGLTQEAIMKVIGEKQNSMKLCLSEAFRKGEKLTGRMEVQITINATGKVTGAAINTDAYKSSGMGACTVKRVSTWKFPRFNGEPVTVVFPYVLQPSF